MAMSDWVTGQVVGKRHWAEGLYSLQFAASINDFQAGQYLKVALDLDGERIGRPYSLANPPQERPLEIFFNAINDGALTEPLAALEVGAAVWLSATAGGIFTLETVQPSETLWLLATGTGLGVYLSILRTATPWERFQRVILVHGVRQVADLAYQELLAELVRQHEGRLQVLAAISRETQPGALSGRITELLTSGALEAAAGATIAPTHSRVMLCGNSAMIKDAKIILEARGLVRHRRQAPGHYMTEHYV
jgi:ferredoxin/flavodoxin---NADP+ reductase